MQAGWALITGATSGLGHEFAQLAAADGMNLVLSARSQSALETLAEDLSSRFSVEAVAIAADLTRPDEVHALWKAASNGREIGTLVNNAGLGAHGDFAHDGARESASIAVNVAAFTGLMALAVADMKARGAEGRILNVASTAGFMPGPNMAVYHATKAYALSLSEAVASELSGSAITVTALCPGATKTGFFESAEVQQTWLMKLTPMGRSDRVAAAGWNAMKAGKRIKITGGLNLLLANSPRLMPRRVLTSIAGMLLTRAG